MMSQVRRKQNLVRYALLPWILAIFLVWILTACGNLPVAQAPSVGEPRLNPATAVKPGDEVSINIDVSNTSDTDITYSWTADGGDIIRGNNSPAATYKAPNEPGVYNVTVEIKWGDQKTSRSASIRVEADATAQPQPMAQQPTDTSKTVEPTIVSATAETPAPSTQEPPSEKVTLTSLKDGQQVPCENVVQGTYTSDFKDKIWPMILVGGKYHPQDQDKKAPTMSNGKWFATVRFGDCTNPEQTRGQSFQLFIVAANQDANKAIEDYFIDAEAKRFPGMGSLPEGAMVLISISVTRK